MKFCWQVVGVLLYPLLATASRIENVDTLFAEDSYRAVAANVSSVFIGNGSLPGPIILTETRAFALVMAGETTIVGAAGSLDDVNGGRVAAFTHGSFLSEADTDEGLGTMMVNLAQWCGKKSDPVVALQSGRSELTELATARFGSFTTAPVAITDAEVLNGDLMNYDMLFAQSHHYDTAEELARLREFLKAGGGVVFYGTAWAFNYPNGFNYELEYPANIVISGTGVNIIGGVDWSYVKGRWHVPTELSDPLVNNAGYAVAALDKHTSGCNCLLVCSMCNDVNTVGHSHCPNLLLFAYFCFRSYSVER